MLLSLGVFLGGGGGGEPPSSFAFVRFITPNGGGATTGTYTETGDYTNGYTYSSTATGSATLNAPTTTGAVSAPIQGDGRFRVDVTSSATDGPVLFIGTANNLTNITTTGALGGIGLNGTTYSRYDGLSSSFVALAGNPAYIAGDTWEMSRTGSTITFNLYRSGSGTAFASYTMTTTSAADLFMMISRSGTATVGGQVFALPRIEV